MTFATITLGCKVNQYETQAMRELLGRFFEEARPDERADVVLVNTCSVTAEADRQARQAMRRARRQHPECRVVAAGCYARRPGVDLIAEGLADRVVPAPTAEALLAALGLSEANGIGRPQSITRMDGHVRAFVKVQDGCDRRCSFCVIPLIRGSNVGRTLQEIIEEIRGLVERGTPEIVLCGVRLNAYRDPGGAGGLRALVEAVLGVHGLRRLRLSSLYPGRLEPGLLELIAEHPRVCRHLHLPLQSGSDEVLRAMRRGYAAADVVALADEVRRRDPDFGLTADVLVGFPGETDADAAETARVAEACGFHHLHLFPFSSRPGTPAERMTPVPESAVRARLDELASLGVRMRDAAQARMVGRDVSVVVEGRPRDGRRRGLTGSYHRVAFADGGVAEGAVASVRVTGSGAGELEGVLHG